MVPSRDITPSARPAGASRSARRGRAGRPAALVTALTTALLVVAGLLLPSTEASASPAAVSATPTAAAARPGGAIDELLGRLWARRVLAGMTTEEKVGQLFSTHVYGDVVDAADPGNVEDFGVATPREVIEKYHLGGILYFSWAHNVDSPQQAAALSNGIQRVALRSGARVPLLLSIDQEGGLVTRLLEPATQTPGGMALGATGDRAGAQQLAAIQGRELAAVGVRQNFAPDADVNVNPANPIIGVRSFGADPAAVSGMVAAQVTGYQRDAGISAAVKHFPGHGDTSVDSHTGIPVITHTREQWDSIDKPPFVAAIRAGVDVIMTAHLQVPALDPSGDPATLSKPIITGVLRGELGYRGVVVTDALNMQGVREKYGDARVPVLALQAGVDILLDPPDLDLAWNSVLSAVRSGEISRARLDESVLRVLQLKWRNGQVRTPFVDVAAVPARVGTPAHLNAVQRVTDRSITVLRNASGLLPLAPTGKRVLVTGYDATARSTVAGALTERGAAATTAAVSTNPTSAEIAAAVTAARGSDLAVVLTYNSRSYAGQPALVAALQAAGVPVVAVAVRNPYDVASTPSVDAALATYGTKPVSLRALVRVITGEVRPAGRLPVAVPAADGSTLYPIGHGLTW